MGVSRYLYYQTYHNIVCERILDTRIYLFIQIQGRSLGISSWGVGGGGRGKPFGGIYKNVCMVAISGVMVGQLHPCPSPYATYIPDISEYESLRKYYSESTLINIFTTTSQFTKQVHCTAIHSFVSLQQALINKYFNFKLQTIQVMFVLRVINCKVHLNIYHLVYWNCRSCGIHQILLSDSTHDWWSF